MRDAAGAALAGVSVYVKGTQRGTVTGSGGGFALPAAPGEVLVFRSVGYKSRELSGGELSGGAVVLEEDWRALEGLEIVGSRNSERTAVQTPVPVDLIPLAEVGGPAGQLDLAQLLQFAVPSFNSNRQAGSDGSDHIDAASLRGLGPDQVLVLVNGKRRHTASLLNLLGTRGRGNVGTDLNSVPMAAIERIEVLRDGASAQYGSDAIAGVINLVLKKNTGEWNVGAGAGVHGAGDGANSLAHANYGLDLNGKGFLNLSGELHFRGKTDRAPAGEPRKIGDSRLANASHFFNGEYALQKNWTAYAFGGLNHRRGNADAWGRAADDERNVPEIYPNGFVPEIRTALWDFSLAAGVRGSWKGWALDASHAFGSNAMDFVVANTLNASMGAASPAVFDAGGFRFSQQVTSLSASRSFGSVLQGLHVALGAERRAENYRLFAGEEASWKNFGGSGAGGAPKAGGAQGFPGFRPSNARNESRANVSAYADAELDVTARWMVGLAARAENYSDFGRTLTGKLATSVRPTESLTLRASLSNGFRAPSLQQAFFNSTYTDFIQGKPAEIVLAPNGGPIAEALGIPALREETSRNASAGFTFRPSGAFTLAVDGYWIGIRDRIVLTGYFSSGDPDVGESLEKLGASQASFFTNALDTETTGADLVASYALALGAGNLDLNAGVNYNRTRVKKVHTSEKLRGKEEIYFGARERLFLEGGAPEWKGSLGLRYQTGPWVFAWREAFFGQVVLGTWSGGDQRAVYRPKAVADCSVSRQLAESVRLTAGASNLFGAKPTRQDPNETDNGGYWDPVQMGFNGAYYFAKLALSF